MRFLGLVEARIWRDRGKLLGDLIDSKDDGGSVS